MALFAKSRVVIQEVFSYLIALVTQPCGGPMWWQSLMGPHDPPPPIRGIGWTAEKSSE